MGIDPDSLLENLSNGQRLDEDVEHKLVVMIEEAVAGSTGRQASLDDVYGYVLVLGKARSVKAIRAFNMLLDEWNDPLTVSKVLEILCLEWDRFEDYLERVISFAVGVSWDEDEDVKQSAIRILGEYLASTLSITNEDELSEIGGIISSDQREVVVFLLRTFYDKSHESWTRKSAYTSLLRATGVEVENLPNECVMLDFRNGSSDICWDRIELLKSLVDYDSDCSSSSSNSDLRAGPAIR